MLSVQNLLNRSERFPVVLVVDSSASMAGGPIAELNAALKVLEFDLKADTEAKRRVRLMIVQGGNERASKVIDWVDAENFFPPQLIASGSAPLGHAVGIALAEIKAELQRLNDEGIPHTRPWLWLLTDGDINDDEWTQAAAECRTVDAAKDILVCPIAITDTPNIERLEMFSAENVTYQLRPESFQNFFYMHSRPTSKQSPFLPRMPFSSASFASSR